MSKLVIALSDFTLLIWIFLGLEALVGRGITPRPWRVMILLTIVTIAYAGLMLWKGQTGARRIQAESPPLRARLRAKVLSKFGLVELRGERIARLVVKTNRRYPRLEDRSGWKLDPARVFVE